LHEWLDGVSVSDDGWGDLDGSSVVGEGVVVQDHGGGVHQRGGDVVEQGGGHDLGLNSGGSLDNSLDNWGVWDSEGWVEDWGGDGVQWKGSWGGEGVEGEDSWGSLDNWGGSLNSLDNWGSSGNSDWGSLDNWGGVDKRSSVDQRSNWGSNNWDSWGNGVNESVLVDVLGESLEGNGGKTTWGLDSVTESWGQRSSNWSVIDIRSSSGGEEKLGVSLSLGLSLVKVNTVNRLVTSLEGSSVSRDAVWAVDVGVGVPVVGVSVWGVVVQRIGFRLSQTK